MKTDYVWYASYGSNLTVERFLCYIKGGHCRYNDRDYIGCTDKSDPLMDRPVLIPHRMYFGNSSKSWGGSGVAFLDLHRDKQVLTLGRMYLITKKQFAEVQEQEGDGDNWYNRSLQIGEMDGYEIYTFTNSGRRPFNRPGESYLKAITDGLKETYLFVDDEWIAAYLASVQGQRPQGFRGASRGCLHTWLSDHKRAYESL